MARKAAIDIGTNSVRLLVAEVSDSIRPLYKTVKTTRLGKGVDSTKVLACEAIVRTVEAIKAFKDKSIAMGADQIVAVATSAVRDARNAQAFTGRVEGLGIKIRVIKGDEEAKLGYYGALLGSGVPGRKMMLVDIGGGSTELVMGTGKEIDFITSLDVGAVRLTERFIKNDPIIQKELANIQKYVHNEFSKLMKVLPENQKLNVVGIGGTITSLAAIMQGLVEYNRELVHGFVMTKQQIQEILDKLSKMPLSEREKTPGLQPERADIIVAGAAILVSILDFLGEYRLTVSEWDNLEGLLYQEFFITDKITG